MKKNPFVFAALLGSLALAGPALANKDHDPAKMQEHIATLRQASNELKATNPDLSKKLEDMANMKQDMMNKKD